jgi:hypothetical protein
MKWLLATAIVLFSFTLTGCVQMHMDTVIEKDGSGTFTMIYAMSTSVAEAMQELSALDMPGEQQDAPTLDDFDKEEMAKACQEHNVKLKKFDRSTVDGKERIEIVMEFQRVEDISKVLNKSTEQGDGMGIFKKADGNYWLRSVELEETAAAPEAEEEAPGMDPSAMQDMNMEAMGKSMEIMGKLMSSASELDVAMRITVPGDIVSHNAQRVEGNTLIWELNSENMMTASSGMEPDIVFSPKGVKIDAPAWED